MPGRKINMNDSTTPSSFTSSSGMLYLGSQSGTSTMNGGAWDATIEGTQNFADYSDHGDMPQDPEETSYHMNSLEDYQQQKWNLGPSPMQRTVSRSSAGSFKNRTVRASAQRTRPRIQTDMSQGASSVFGASGASAASGAAAAVAGGYTMTGDAFSTTNAMASAMTSMPAVASGFFSDASAASSNQMLQQQYFPLYQPGLTTTAYSTDGLNYASDLGSAFDAPVQQHVDPACTQVVKMDFETSTMGSPHTLESRSSRRSSPDIGGEDGWSFRLDSSPAESHDSTVSSFAPLSVSDDTVHSSMNGEFGTSAPMQQRSNSESDSVRDHPLYKKANPDANGLYHCPWEGESSCNHKPEKLKCNYDKYVDSHLKPYRCKNPLCENTRFSSTACLLRHEREAHAMHGHGDKPYLCTYDGCERAAVGNGFPRQWNLKDHMRRVHHDDATQATSAAATLPSPPTTSSGQAISKGRKRKKDSVSSSGGHGSSPSRKSSARVSKSQQVSSLDAGSSRSHHSESSSRSQAQLQAAAAKAQLDQSFKLWTEHKAALADLVMNMGQPYALQTAQQLQEAQTHLSVLQQIPHTMTLAQGAPDMVAYGRQQSG